MRATLVIKKNELLNIIQSSSKRESHLNCSCDQNTHIYSPIHERYRYVQVYKFLPVNYSGN